MKVFLLLSAFWLVVSVLGYTWVRYDITALENTYEHYLTSSGFKILKPPPKTSYGSLDELVDDVTTVMTDASALPEVEYRLAVDSHFGSTAIAQQKESLLMRLSIAWLVLTALPILCGIVLILSFRGRSNHRLQLTGCARDMM